MYSQKDFLMGTDMLTYFMTKRMLHEQQLFL